MRGHGDPTTDDLPPSPPKFSFKHQIYDAPTFVAKSLDFEDSKEGKPLVLDASIVRYTRFASTATPSKIVDRVSEVIHAMSGKTAVKDHFKVKAQFGDVSFVAQVFTDPSSEKNVVVDFRKKSGSAVEFRSLYQEIRAQLADIVLQPTSSKKSTTDTDTVETEVEVSVSA